VAVTQTSQRTVGVIMTTSHYVVKGQATDPAAQALRAWLDARHRLEAAMEPLSRRVGTPVDPAVLTDLRTDEDLAWQQFRTARVMDEGGAVGDRDRLDALGMVEAASEGIHQALRAAQDSSGELNPGLVDLDLVERHRDGFGFGLDSFEEELGRGRADDLTDEEYARIRRDRFGQLPGRIRPADLVEVVEPNAIRETHEPAEPRREWG
jgi:hypothetical protein